MRLILLLLSIILTGHGFSKCSSRGLWAYPQVNTIEVNSWIILEGYASSQPIIDSLNKGYPIYLESDGKKIPLKVEHKYTGGFRLTQAVLTPTEKLIIGKTYYLKIDNLKSNEEDLLVRWNSDLREYEPIFWTVREGNDKRAPNLLKAPQLIDKSTINYGCGPAVYAIFKMEAEDANELFIKTELIDLESAEVTTYFLNFDKSTDTLAVGHGMCSGAFHYRSNGKYKIRFSLFDTNGNSNGKWSDWIVFDCPYEGFN